MGYAITPVVVEVERFESVLGSGSTDLLSELLESDPELAEFDEDDEDEIPVADAVRDLLLGETLDPAHVSEYGYALEAIAVNIGEVLPACEVHWTLLVECGLAAAFTPPPPVLKPLHATKDDFPKIAWLPFDKVATLRKSLLTSGGDESTVDDIASWLDHVTPSTSLLLFYY